MLKEMKKNPVTPASQIFKFELDQDKESWQDILQEEHEIDGWSEKFFEKLYILLLFQTKLLSRQKNRKN